MKLLVICTLAITSFFMSPDLYALVDYSDTAQFSPPASRGAGGVRVKKKRTRSASRSVRAIKRSSSAAKPRDMGVLRTALGMESVSIQGSEHNSKATIYRMEGHFQTPYNIYFDTSYWYGASSAEEFAEIEGSKAGNPIVKIGLNWLQMGGVADLAMVNLYGGAMIPQDNAIFASSRLDKIVGIETSKRFYSFVFGLGYDLRMTGTPGDEEEMDIGNIHGIKAALGWTVSHDIRFLLEADSYRVLPKNYNSNEKKQHDLALDRELKFSHVTTKLFLGLGPFVEMALGARFRTSSPEEGEVPLEAKLWDLPAGYGNSIFSSLNISI